MITKFNVFNEALEPKNKQTNDNDDFEYYENGKTYLLNVETEKNTIFVGYIMVKPGQSGPFAWTWDGKFKKCINDEEANAYIEELKQTNIHAKYIRKFTAKEYKHIYDLKMQGYEH
jgi:hypothetical protein